MNTIIFIGPPGSGKGTQAQLAAKELGLEHISTGKMLRDLREARPHIAQIIDKGGLVPDDEVLDVLYGKIDSLGHCDQLILDGTPRRLYQYEKMKPWFGDRACPIDKVIFINLSEEEAVKRLLARREDGYKRADDNAETIKERFKVYRETTQPLIVKMKEDGILHEVDGDQSIEDVFSDVKKIILDKPNES